MQAHGCLGQGPIRSSLSSAVGLTLKSLGKLGEDGRIATAGLRPLATIRCRWLTTSPVQWLAVEYQSQMVI